MRLWTDGADGKEVRSHNSFYFCDRLTHHLPNISAVDSKETKVVCDFDY